MHPFFFPFLKIVLKISATQKYERDILLTKAFMNLTQEADIQ